MNKQVTSPIAETSAIRLATPADKAVAIDILTHAFWNDPHVNWYSGSGPDKERKIRALMSFAFEKSYANGDVYVTTNQTAVAIWKNSRKQAMTLRLLGEYLKFLWIYGISKVRAIGKLEQQVESRYPKNRPMYYLWVLGTHPDHQGKGLGSQLMNPLLEEAQSLGIDTYLETTNIRNLPVYQKKGFERYDKLEVPASQPVTIYFMRKQA